MNIQGWGWQQLLIFVIVAIVVVWAITQIFPVIVAPFT